MEERPILFNSEMVRAILEGRKSQTRRINKLIPVGDHYGKDIMDWPLSAVYKKDGVFYCEVQIAADDHTCFKIKCPYGEPGDRLWVRETFTGIKKVYASGKMPQWASRITLEITNIRVEKLQDITGKEVIKEGIGEGCVYPRKAFEVLWDSGTKDGSKWKDNPWVWVIEFKKKGEDKIMCACGFPQSYPEPHEHSK